MAYFVGVALLVGNGGEVPDGFGVADSDGRRVDVRIFSMAGDAVDMDSKAVGFGCVARPHATPKAVRTTAIHKQRLVDMIVI